MSTSIPEGFIPEDQSSLNTPEETQHSLSQASDFPLLTLENRVNTAGLVFLEIFENEIEQVKKGSFWKEEIGEMEMDNKHVEEDKIVHGDSTDAALNRLHTTHTGTSINAPVKKVLSVAEAAVRESGAKPDHTGHSDSIKAKITAKMKEMQEKSGLSNRSFWVLVIAAVVAVVVAVVAALVFGGVVPLAFLAAAGAVYGAVKAASAILAIGSALVAYVAGQKMIAANEALARAKDDKETYEAMKAACAAGKGEGSYLAWIESIESGYYKEDFAVSQTRRDIKGVKEDLKASQPLHKDIRKDVKGITEDLQLFRIWQKENELNGRVEKLKGEILAADENCSPAEAERQARSKISEDVGKLTLKKQYVLGNYGLLPKSTLKPPDASDIPGVERRAPYSANFRTWLEGLGNDPMFGDDKNSAFKDLLKNKEDAALFENDKTLTDMHERHGNLNAWKSTETEPSHSEKTPEEQIAHDRQIIKDYLIKKCDAIRSERRDALERDVKEINTILFSKSKHSKHKEIRRSYIGWTKDNIIDKIKVGPGASEKLSDDAIKACEKKLREDKKFRHGLYRDVELYRLWRMQDVTNAPLGDKIRGEKFLTVPQMNNRLKLERYRLIDRRPQEEIDKDIKTQMKELPIKLQDKVNQKLAELIRRAEQKAEKEAEKKAEKDVPPPPPSDE